MMNYNVSQIINDIKRATKPFVVHNDFIVRNTGLQRFVSDKRITQQIEKEVMVPIKKKNVGFYSHITPIDNKFSYCVNSMWAMDFSIFNDEDVMELYMIYVPLRDTIFYFLAKDKSMYVHRNNRIELISLSKNPSSLISVDYDVINTPEKYDVIKSLPQMPLGFGIICSGSILTDLMDFMLGRRACLFIGDSEFRKSTAMMFCKEIGLDVVAVNGVYILVNSNAKPIVDEDNMEVE